MKVSTKQMQEKEKRQERIAELKKIKDILLKIIECEKVEAVDKLKCVDLIVEITKALDKAEFNPLSLT